MNRFFVLFLGFLFCTFGLVHCAHYKSQTEGERRLIFAGKGMEAAKRLEEKAHKPGKDQLLYLLDLGIAYHTAGQYESAVKTFLKAEEIAEIKDFTSITEETGTLLVTDNVKNYKGEDFEKILIHVYLAIDFLMMGQLESAMVESRKVNSYLYRLIHEGNRPYKLNPLAYYLSGFIYEKNGDLNDAYIDYKSAQKVIPDFAPLGEDLKLVSKKLGFHQEHSKWNEIYPDKASISQSNPTGRLDLKKKGYGDVFVLVEVGKAPEKIPHPQWESLPKFRNVRSRFNEIHLELNGKDTAVTEVLFSVEQAAHVNLDHRIAAMTAKKIGGVAAKAAVGVGVGALTDNKELGVLTTMLLMAADQADLRSWLTLPASFQVARISVPAGKHSLRLKYGRNGSAGSEGRTLEGLEVKAGSHVIVHHRVIEP